MITGIVPALRDVLRSGGARAGLLVLACSMVGHVSNYLYYVLAARTLSPAQFSDVSAMTALATIALMPASGVQAAVARDTAALLASGRRSEADQLTRWLSRRVLVLQAGLLVVLLLGAPAAVAVLGLSSTGVWVLGVVWLVLGVGLQIGLGALQGRERFGAVGAILAIPMGALRPLLLIPAVAVGGVSGAVSALGVATLAGVVVIVVIVRRSLDRRGAGTTALTGLLPAVAALTAFAALTNADVLAAKVVLSPTAAGLYASAALLGKIALYAPSALALVLLPKVTARLQAGLSLRGPALLTMIATFGTGAVITLGILAAPSTLVSAVFGAHYSSAYHLAAPIAAVMTLASLLQVHLMMALAAGGRTTIIGTAAAAVGQVIGLSTLAHSAGQVVIVSAVATGVATLVHEVGSPYGIIRLLRGGPRPVTVDSPLGADAQVPTRPEADSRPTGRHR